MKKRSIKISADELMERIENGLWVNQGIGEHLTSVAYMKTDGAELRVTELPLLRDRERKMCLEGIYDRPVIVSRYALAGLKFEDTPDGVIICYDRSRMAFITMKSSDVPKDIIACFEDKTPLVYARLEADR